MGPRIFSVDNDKYFSKIKRNAETERNKYIEAFKKRYLNPSSLGEPAPMSMIKNPDKFEAEYQGIGQTYSDDTDFEELEIEKSYVPYLKKLENTGDKVTMDGKKGFKNYWNEGEYAKDPHGDVITDKHGNPKKRWTSGWGHSPADGSVEPEGWVSVEQANKDLREDIKGKALKRIRNNVKINDFDKFSPSLKQDIVASYFRGGLSGSPDTREHINAKKYDEAAREFLRHNEYEDQVTGDGKKPGIVPRMNRLSRALINEGKVFKEYEKAFDNKPKNKKKKKK